MERDEQIWNFKVEGGPKPIFVQDYLQESFMELYGPPISEGNLEIEVDL